MKTSRLLLVALLDSLGALAYVFLIVFLMNNGQRFFGPANNFFGSVAILLLFVVSATTVGLLVLGRPRAFIFQWF